MTPWLTALRGQLRHLSVAQLLIDVLMITAVGMLSMFVLLLASFQSFDALHFEAGLRYDSREIIDHDVDDGLTLAVSDDAYILSEQQYDAPSRSSGDFTESVAPTVWTYSDDDSEPLSAFLGSTIVSGRVADGQVLLDEASAAALGVSAGDKIVIGTDAGDCRVTVSGLTRPYHEVGGATLDGLLAVPAAACPNVIAPAGSSPQFLQFNGRAPSSAAQAWGERMRDVAIIATDYRVSGLLPAILLVGLALWTILTLSASRRVRNQLGPASDLLVELGCRTARARATHLLVMTAVALITAVGAAAGARAALWHVASFYSQTLHWLSVALLFAGVTIAVVFVSYALARRRNTAAPARTATLASHERMP